MPSDRPAVQEVWSLLLGIAQTQRERFLQIAAGLELSPGDVRTLLTLDGEGQPMRALAGRWGCDASNVTGMVDRLERRGLVERRSRAGDRRVKAAALTEHGAALRRALLDQLHEPPALLLDLEPEALEALRSGLSRIAPPGRGAGAR